MFKCRRRNRNFEERLETNNFLGDRGHMGIRKTGETNSHTGFPAVSGAIGRSIKKVCQPRELCGFLDFGMLDCLVLSSSLGPLPALEKKKTHPGKRTGVGKLGPTSHRTVICGHHSVKAFEVRQLK